MIVTKTKNFPKIFNDLSVVGSAELRKLEHENKTGGNSLLFPFFPHRLPFCAPSPLSESLDKARRVFPGEV